MRNTGRGGEEKRCLLRIVGSRYEEVAMKKRMCGGNGSFSFFFLINFFRLRSDLLRRDWTNLKTD